MRLATGAAALLAVALAASPVGAQETRIIFPGAMAVTGFPGTHVPDLDQAIAAGVDPVDETFIDPSRAVLRIFDVSALGRPAEGQSFATPPPFEVTAGQIGLVFAMTYDDGLSNGRTSGVPDLYAASSSLYGIGIVTPDVDGDGRPERQRRGRPGATFMEGQFAEKNGGRPGAIWKIDGESGAVSLFSAIDANSGPGIGDIAFDDRNRQFFASDLDSGLVHRIGEGGALIDTFDHGVDGRPAGGLAPVADDGPVMDIHDAAFDSEDPDTWGFTPDERRVWGVQVHGDRVYYAAGERAEVWSIGIAADGRFAGDARRELTVAGADIPVTDIAFDGRGFMYLARRGQIGSRYDYGEIARSSDGVVLRYRRANQDDPVTKSIWVEVPREHGPGLARSSRQSGGIDLHYDYLADGKSDRRGCSDTIVMTGGSLRDDPAIAGPPGAGGLFKVRGVRITRNTRGEGQDERPSGSWFVDYDGFSQVSGPRGDIGDVEIWRPGEGRAGRSETGSPVDLACGPDEPKKPTIAVGKTGDRQCTVGMPCTFEITVTNVGHSDFAGPVRIADAVGIEGFGRIEDVAVTEIAPPFGCAEGPTSLPVSCTVDLVLAAGASRVHRMTVVVPGDGRFGGRDGPHEGRACVAVLDPETPVAVLPEAQRSMGTGNPAGGSVYACHSFELSGPERAVSIPIPEPRPQTGTGSKPQPCTLLAGMVRTEAGECVCPKGASLRNGACRAVTGGQPESQQCRLLPGQVRTKDGQCVCPRGSRLVRGQCRQQVVECKQDQKLVNGRCVAEPRPMACKRGQRVRNGKCVDVQATRCPAGTTGKPPNCRPLGVDVPRLLLQPGILKSLPRRQPGGKRTVVPN
ncbi:MAG: EB domain-containing protein [Rhizobiaceae bacterium]